MLVIGDDELSGVLIREGDIIRSLKTKEYAKVELAISKDTKKKTDSVCFVTLQDGNSYVVGVGGNLFTDLWELIDE